MKIKTLRSLVLAIMLAAAGINVRPAPQWSSSFAVHKYGAPATFLAADGP